MLNLTKFNFGSGLTIMSFDQEASEAGWAILAEDEAFAAEEIARLEALWTELDADWAK